MSILLDLVSRRQIAPTSLDAIRSLAWFTVRRFPTPLQFQVMECIGTARNTKEFVYRLLLASTCDLHKTYPEYSTGHPTECPPQPNSQKQRYYHTPTTLSNPKKYIYNLLGVIAQTSIITGVYVRISRSCTEKRESLLIYT